MREELAKLRAAHQVMKKAGMFKKALAAEDVLEAALVLIEKMVGEIKRLKADKREASRP